MTLPLRWRLVLLTTTLMAVVLATIGTVILVRFHSDLIATVDASLRLRAERLADAPTNQTEVLGELTSASEPDESFGQILNRSGAVLDSSEGLTSGALLTAAQLVSVPTNGQFRSADVDTTEEMVPARLFAMPMSDDRIAVIGASIEDQNDAINRLVVLMVIGGVVAVALSGVAGWVVAGFALRPIDRMRREASQISGTHQQRLAVPATRDELERLATTLNEMLDRLDSAGEAQRRFIADASHELRTPLANLKLEVDVALRDAPDAAALSMALQSMRAELDGLIELSGNLLDLAHASEQGMSLQLRPLDLRPLLDEEIAHFATRAASSSVDLELTGPSAIHVSGDELRLRQVVGNLLDNAIRHSPAASTVRVRAAASPESITVEVVDEGDGLPSNSSDLFTPFWRADEGRARDGGGVGLGLSITRAIVEAHGGSIEAESRPEGGSAFLFVLPR